VLVKLTPKGTDQLKKFSQKHLKHFLAIYARDRLLFAARLSEPITTGELAIAGRLDTDRAREIRDAIRRCMVPPKKKASSE
jgi:preprotein translocase subunit SecD